MIDDLLNQDAYLDRLDWDAVRGAIGLNLNFYVDHSLTFEQMVYAACDVRNSCVTEEVFPVKGNGIVAFEARHLGFNRGVYSRDAWRKIGSEDTKNPWAPAEFDQLLAYGASFPDKPLKFPIVGLGSIGKVGDRYVVPYLGRSGPDRSLDLMGLDRLFPTVFRFLAVRPVARKS
ncbi:MAG: hypothetical protein WCW36_03465 [Candidatus Paceibacterota bacterium]